MKKIKQVGPIMLVNKVFTIPLFSAAHQQYVCTEVAELGTTTHSKTYGIYFKWLPSTYSVPEVLRMDIEIYKQNVKPFLVMVSLYEKTNSGNYVVTCNGHFDEDYISTPAKIQTMIERLINR
jgi:hypothetical protein